MDLAFQIRQLFKIGSQKLILPAAYWLNSRGKDTEKQNRVILLADAHHHACPESMQLVAQALQEKAKAEHLTILEEYLDYGSAGVLRTTAYMLRFMRLYAGADVVVLCDNFLPAASCKKKSSTKVVQLWHACGALKKFGYDTTEDIPATYSGHVYANLDVVTVSSPAAVRHFASAMRLPQKVMHSVGVSRTDRFFDQQFLKDCRERFARRYPRSRGRKVVLWAPTFRGNAARTRNISLDLKKLQKALGEEYFVVSSLHPHMLGNAKNIGNTKNIGNIWNTMGKNRIQGAFRRSKTGNAGKSRIQGAFRREKTGSAKRDTYLHLSTLEMLPAVDVLVADYSSLVYEYLLLKKSLVLYVPDLEQYREERGFYMDIDELPAVIVTEEDQLSDAILQAVSDAVSDTSSYEVSNVASVIALDTISDSSADDGQEQLVQSQQTDQYDAFLQKWMSGCDGHATERIVEEILS